VSSFHSHLDYGVLNVYSSGVLNLESLISEDHCLMNLVYIYSAEEIEEFSQFVFQFTMTNTDFFITAGCDHKASGFRALSSANPRCAPKARTTSEREVSAPLARSQSQMIFIS
jgi:hypothetical protein